MASTSSYSSTPKTIILKSSDIEQFEVEENVISQSETIKNMIEDDCAVVPLPNVTASVLAKVIEYCKKHAGGDHAPYADDELAKWDAEFVTVDDNTEHS